jgi:peptidoglycan/LPS O-acetylase OafA/YrhL
MGTVVAMTAVRDSFQRHLTPPSPMGRRGPAMIAVRVRAVVFAVPLVVGAVAYYLLSAKTGRAALSYAGGVGLTALLLIGGLLAVRAGAALSPVIATLMALSTYTTVAFVLAAVFAVADPHVLDEPAFALGLVVGVVFGVALQIRDARPPANRV